jgi:hypothetical protein
MCWKEQYEACDETRLSDASDDINPVVTEAQKSFLASTKLGTRRSKNGLVFVFSYLPPFPMARAVNSI